MNKIFLCRSLVWACLVSFTLCVTGCTSVNVRSNKDQASVRKVNRLFIIIQHGEMDDQPFSNDLSLALRNAFTNTSAVMEMSIANPVELDPKTHLRQAEAFNADAILVITSTGGIMSEYGGYPTITYDASLYEKTMEKRIWRAQINNSGGTALMKRRMREMAVGIVEKLRGDGFL